MKSKVLYTGVCLLMSTNTLLAQRDPGEDPDLPIDDHIWVLISAGVLLGIFVLMRTKKRSISLFQNKQNL